AGHRCAHFVPAGGLAAGFPGRLRGFGQQCFGRCQAAAPRSRQDQGGRLPPRPRHHAAPLQFVGQQGDRGRVPRRVVPRRRGRAARQGCRPGLVLHQGHFPGQGQRGLLREEIRPGRPRPHPQHVRGGGSEQV
ncbi:MAG: hypothetical protein AVDCRST_MAG56-3125, partial [uncultured Cytophagales bacterium]